MAQLNPAAALEALWTQEYVHQILFEELNQWFYMGLTEEGAITNYAEKGFLKTQLEFVAYYRDLLPLIEASYIYVIGRQIERTTGEWPDKEHIRQRTFEQQDYLCVYFDEDYDPVDTMKEFCQKYPLPDARRFLLELMRAVECNTGPFREGTSAAPSYLYEIILTILEATYSIAIADLLISPSQN